MRVRFINRVTGSITYVDESRAEEYKAAGHVPAALSSPVIETPTEKEPEPVKKKAARSRKK